MSVISLEDFKNGKTTRREVDDGEANSPVVGLVSYDEDAEMEDIVFISTQDPGVVLLTDPMERSGAFLTPEQAAELGAALLRYSSMSRYADILAALPDHE